MNRRKYSSREVNHKPETDYHARRSPQGDMRQGLGLQLRNTVEELFSRVAASGFLPASWYLSLPDPAAITARNGKLAIEIVSHCWQYQHLLAYQLSSLVNFPPTRAAVRMTVFHAGEDLRTRAMLDFFGGIQVPGVTWNWRALEAGRLFRRSIGRNLIARSTAADWVWFTDCDIIFHRDCLDTLVERLQGRTDRMVYPCEERVTAMLAETDLLLASGRDQPRVVDIDTRQFERLAVPQAKGGYQIVHGDIARSCGYCEQVAVFQRPVQRWAKAFDDRTYRWLLQSDGTPLEVPGVYRIRHLYKGRYGDNKTEALIRGNIRRVKRAIKARWQQ
ncbi:MAG: glycosyltransferase family 2 protein [Burkholderiales bacterium]